MNRRTSPPARAAVLKLFSGNTALTDVFLACLYLEGFKVVPLDGTEAK